MKLIAGGYKSQFRTCHDALPAQSLKVQILE